MTHRLRVLCALLLASGVAAAPLATPASAQTSSHRTQLVAAINKAIAHSSAKHVDFAISDASTGTISHGANYASAPASNQKLFTVMTVLSVLSPNFSYLTKVSATSPISHGVLASPLIIRGSGDPTLTTADLHSLAHRLHLLGLRRITGGLIVDDSRYSHTTLARGWKHSFVPSESGAMDAFTVNHNNWRHGAAFAKNPTKANAGLWRKALTKAHITVHGPTVIKRTPRGATTLVSHHSGSLAEIIAATLTYSINFDAEMMLREAGAQVTGVGSAASGLRVERAYATANRLPHGTVYDGSGLSYSDRETPATILAWLTSLRSQSDYGTVFAGLPIACTSGTLGYRLCGRNVKDKVFAKTGTLDHVTALSGYLTSKAGNAITFSFLVSGAKSLSKAMAAIDRAVVVLRIDG